MESNTLFFKVSTGGSLLQGQQGSDLTYRYVGGIARAWETKKGNFRNVWAFKEAVRRLVGGDPDIKIFFEVVNDEGLRHLRPLQTHEDASALVEIGTAIPFTKIFVVPTRKWNTSWIWLGNRSPRFSPVISQMTVSTTDTKVVARGMPT